MRLTLLLALLAVGASAQSIRRLDGSSITAEYAETLARQTLTQANVTGAQLAIVNDGRLVWSMAHGLRQLDPPLPMTPETTTWAASITKAVFATFVLQLAERGEFDLDIPIARQLRRPLTDYPEYKETASHLVRHPHWPLITPRMALNHTSGLNNLAVLAPDKKISLRFQPGARFGYSGEALNLLQMLIEEQKGRPIDDLMQESIFAPLGMTRTAMRFRPEFAENIADRFGSKGEFLAKTRRNARAAGSMTTTAEDLGRFAAGLFADQLLRPETRRQLLAPTVPIRTARQFQAAPQPEGRPAKELGLAYGLGWGLLTKTRFGPAFFKEGHGDGAQTFMICFERGQSCMILLTNSDNGEQAFRPLLETLFGNTVTPWEWHGYPH